MGQLWQDIRYGARLLRKSPAFTLVAAIILALGCGANTAIFSILNAVVLRPLPYKNPADLYRIDSMTAKGARWFSAADLETWRERTQVFEAMAAVQPVRAILSDVPNAEQLFGLAVSRECFPLLGTAPIRGRWFGDLDFNPTSVKTVVIGEHVWQRSFGGNADIVGKHVTLDGTSFVIIGVMPAEFQFNERRCEYWVPYRFTSQDLADRDLRSFQVYARAKPGITRQQVQVEAASISALLSHQFPESHESWRATASPLRDAMVADARPSLFLMLGVVTFVLLIACLNVANLLLARGMERAKEIAIRVALGARRLRVIRQLLTECLLLAISGALLGLLMAGWANKWLIALFSQRTAIPRLEQTSIDGRVLCFTLFLALISTVLFGLIPALQASKLDLNEVLKEGARSGMGSVRRSCLRSSLIIAETALSLVLLAGAGLMLRSFVHLLHVNPGFRTERLLTARLPMPAYRFPDREQQAAYYTEILSRIQSLPDVQSAGLVTVLPLSGAEATLAISDSNGKMTGRPYPFRAVSPEYFQTMGIPVILGRPFTALDTAQNPRIAIVSEALARELWPGVNPLGKMFNNWARVVGVVGNVRHAKLSVPPEAEIYVPYLQFLGTPMSSLVVRTRTDPLAIVPAVRRTVRGFQPDQPIADIRSMEEVVSDSVAQPRFYTLLLSIFAGLALVLASAGIYGVTSYWVSQRQHEIGVRMAVGAQKRDILRMFMGQGALFVLIGITIGIAGALATAGLLSSMLFEVKPTDPLTYGLVSALLFAWTLLGIYVPARRATKVDPLAALRDQ
jgi:putative ABC transport system permease protein